MVETILTLIGYALNVDKMKYTEQEIKGILVNFFREGTNGDYLDALNTAIKEIWQVKNCPIPDADNYDYLRGFIDGYGGEEPHDVFPDGFKDINEVWDKMYELKGNEA